jgi:flagellar hook assembly protein FlgD
MMEIGVYDILGRKVATLASEVMPAGYYTVTWNGRNSVGASVASGMYVVRMNAQADNGATFSAIRKLLLMK